MRSIFRRRIGVDEQIAEQHQPEEDRSAAEQGFARAARAAGSGVASA
jgi:hypothetical protein